MQLSKIEAVVPNLFDFCFVSLMGLFLHTLLDSLVRCIIAQYFCTAANVFIKSCL